MTRLNEHYLKIGKMVPEWKKKLDMKTMSRLQESVKAGRYQDISLALDTLNEGCESCHTDYRIITANMYRAPDFSSIKIDPSTSYKEHMKKLTQQVNNIKIAFVDGNKDIALSTLSDLKQGINAQGETCSWQCGQALEAITKAVLEKACMHMYTAHWHILNVALGCWVLGIGLALRMQNEDG